MAKSITGIVSSNKTDKTIIISVVTRKTHPIYKKQYISTKKFMAHDEKNEAKLGDKVNIAETKPISARKRFKLVNVIDHAVLTKEDMVEGTVELPQKQKQEIVPKTSKKEEKPEDNKENAIEEVKEDKKDEKPKKAVKKPAKKEAKK